MFSTLLYGGRKLDYCDVIKSITTLEVHVTDIITCTIKTTQVAGSFFNLLIGSFGTDI